MFTNRYNINTVGALYNGHLGVELTGRCTEVAALRLVHGRDETIWPL